MKFFLSILAISIGCMSFIPCGDDILANGCSSEDAHHHPPGEKPDDHEDSDFCSPFCICSCCQTHMVTLDLIQEETEKLAPIHVKSETEPSLIDQEAIFECWHPPNV